MVARHYRRGGKLRDREISRDVCIRASRIIPARSDDIAADYQDRSLLELMYVERSGVTRLLHDLERGQQFL
ncbi:hypothetical protein WL40_33170 [Burkholderia ubonensis]|nr:hypothetical protein WL40_33170 [Burkholderia ubonensis]